MKQSEGLALLHFGSSKEFTRVGAKLLVLQIRVPPLRPQVPLQKPSVKMRKHEALAPPESGGAQQT